MDLLEALGTLAPAPSVGRQVDKIAIDDPEAVTAARRYLTADALEKAAKARKESVKGALLPKLRRAWFEANYKAAKSRASLAIVTPGKGELQISFSASWSPKDGVVAALPADLTRTSFEITIDGDELPADKASTFVTELSALAARLGVSTAVKAKVVTVPSPGFGTLRHHRLSVEQNLALEDAGLGTKITFKKA